MTAGALGTNVSLVENVRRGYGLGWSYTPLRGKCPLLSGWPKLPRETLEEALGWATNGNVGLRTGLISGIVVIDADPGADISGLDLPPTVTVNTGRPGGRHFYLQCAEPIGNSSGKLGPHIDVRGDGGQVVFPGSIHPDTGRQYEWAAGYEPWSISIAEMPAHILTRLREPTKTTLVKTALVGPSSQPVVKGDRYAKAALKHELEALGAAPEGQRNDTLNKAAFSLGTLVSPGCLNRQEVEAALRQSALDIGLEPGEIEAAIRSGMESGIQQPRQLPGRAGDQGVISLGDCDPATGKIVLSAKRTLPTAEAYVEKFHSHADGRTLHHYAGLLIDWQENRYTEIEDEAVKNRLQPWLHDALQYTVDRKTQELALAPFNCNPTTVNGALDTIRTLVHLPGSITPPTWLNSAKGQPDAREVLACRTLNLHLPTGLVFPATPLLFATNSLDFDYNAHASTPVHWLGFLDQLWGADTQAIQLLQEWFGYCLTVDTAQQKMLMIVGPKRSGKGTIGRVLQRLVGPANVAGPTTRSLAGAFGLQPLIGKSLAIVSDARFSGDDVGTVVERLLCISGEDALTIDRKYLGSVTTKLPTRFVFLTNELPRFADASTALAGRFMILRLTQSFYGREDPTLTGRLLTELPGILLWALQGWKRLRERGRFVQPESVADAIRDLEDLSSPVGAFVRDRCVVEPGRYVETGALFSAWRSYCGDMGRDHVGTVQTFGRDLRAAVPGLCVSQPRAAMGRLRWYLGIALAPNGMQLPGGA